MKTTFAKYLPVLVLTVLFFLLSFISYSQDLEHHHASLLHPYSAQRLADNLTKKLHTDDEKVEAIHYWITHHINYDVKKFLRFDYRAVSTSNILRRRKAICTGYSDLFNELCLYSGIKSVSVDGYLKDRYIDQGDTSYLDEHEWNAVYLDGKWQLVDVCWDAGYLKHRYTTVGRKVLHVISLGLIKRLKLKTLFVRSPSTFYYLKPGDFFKTDHLPLNPIWQMTTPSISIGDFDKDSSFYYQRFNNSANAFTDAKIEVQQSDYFSSDDTRRCIEDGKAGYAFNKRNNYEIAWSYYLIAKKDWGNIDTLPKDTTIQRVYCDTIITRLNTGIKFLHVNDSLLLIERGQRLTTNNKKAGIFRLKNGQFISRTQKIFNSFNNYVSQKKSATTLAKSLQSSINSRNKNLARSNVYYTIRSSKTLKTEDSIKLCHLLLQANDSIRLLSKSFFHTTQYAGNLDTSVTGRMRKYIGLTTNVNQLATDILSARMSFSDDLDHEIIPTREYLMAYKQHCDSLLFINDTSVIKYLSVKNSVARDLFNRLYTAYKIKSALLKNLKRVTLNSEAPEGDYKATIDSMYYLLNYQSGKVNQWLEKSTEIAGLSKTIVKQVEKELKIYRFEKRIEEINNANRISFIFNRSRSLIKASRQLRKSSLQNKQIVKSYQRKLKRAIK